MRLLLTIILIGAFHISPLSAEELPGTLKEVKDSGKIKVGYRQSLPPMSFLGKDGTPSGYSVDLCNHIVAGVESKIGRKVTVDYVPVSSEDRFEALTTKCLNISEMVWQGFAEYATTTADVDQAQYNTCGVNFTSRVCSGEFQILFYL